MAMGVAMPQQKDPLDKVLQALQLVQAGFGIKTAYDQVKLNKMKMDSIEADEEARKTGVLSDEQMGKLNMVPAGTEGAQVVLYGHPKLDEAGQPVIGDNGKIAREVKPTWVMTPDQMQGRNQNFQLAQAMGKAYEHDLEKNGVILPSKMNDWVIFSKPTQGAEKKMVELPGGGFKEVYAKPRTQAAYDAGQQKQASQLDAREFKIWSDRINKDRSDYEKAVSPIAQDIATQSKLRGTIELAKSGGPLEPGMIEGLIATTVAGAAQKGVMTDKDFQRGSLVPQSLWGQGEQAVQKWFNDAEPTTRLQALEQMLQYQERSSKNQYDQVLTQLKARHEMDNRTFPDKMKIDWKMVAPMEPFSNQPYVQTLDQSKGTNRVDPRENAADNLLNKTGNNQRGVVPSLKSFNKRGI
jgi:hypothetical protein